MLFLRFSYNVAANVDSTPNFDDHASPSKVDSKIHPLCTHRIHIESFSFGSIDFEDKYISSKFNLSVLLENATTLSCGQIPARTAGESTS